MPEARFCRVCGMLLKRTGQPGVGGADDGGVSPGAKTVPLSGEGRPTKGIAADDPQAPVTNTSKVKRAEMDELLRRTRPADYTPARGEDGSKHALEDIHASAPSTNELKPPQPETPAAAAEAVTPASAAPSNSRTATKRSARRRWPIIISLFVALALLAGLIIFLSTGRDEPASANTNSAPAPPPANDQKRLVDERLADAEALLAAGQTSEAIARLRSAIELDPTNALAHRRLGEALEKSGERQAAIDEYRISTLNDQSNEEGWRALASAQLAEGRFNDAVESYRRLIALKGEEGVDDETRMDYAQALLLAGRTEDARAVYQRVAASGSQDLASKAKRQLAQLPQLPSINANTQPTRDGRVELPPNNNSQVTQVPAPTPTVQPTPAPTVQPTPTAATPNASDNSAQLDPDVYYEWGLKIIGRSDLKSLPRAELLQALEYFQRAQSGGTHRAEATRYVQQLGREYDRRKKQSQP
ncbi:MAG TPA: tetratricopeptide repeat protein [Pyrinomonadaceae bacterium]|jgi:tetratricopeptide (TPR) repeat protein